MGNGAVHWAPRKAGRVGEVSREWEELEMTAHSLSPTLERYYSDSQEGLGTNIALCKTTIVLLLILQ